MFIVDDLLYQFTIYPFVFIFEKLRDFAYCELYNLEKIDDQIKENALLHELGEMAKAEYEERNAELLEKRKLALMAKEMALDSKLDILGGTLDVLG